MHLLRRLRPVDGTHGLIQHGGIADPRRILGRGRHLAAFKPGQGLAQQFCTQHRQMIQQLPRRLVFADGSLGNVNDVSGVHLPGQVHGGDAGLRQAVQHRPLIGGGPAVFGQQAGMDVDAAVFRHVQHLLGQDAPVGHHSADIRLHGTKLLYRFFLPEIFRLEHGDSGSHGHLLHRRRHQLHAPSLGAVGLGVDAHHIEAVGQYFFQAGRRDVRRTHKHNAQGYPSVIRLVPVLLPSGTAP